MSRSYRRCFHKLAAGAEARGEKSDKQHSNRKIRRANKKRTAKAAAIEDNEPTRPFMTKRHIEVYNFAGDGKVECEPGPYTRTGFHFKRLVNGKIRMIK